MYNKEDLKDLFFSEIREALGCTEPACAALAGAKARDLVGGPVCRADVYVSRDMMKNAMGVSIPNSELSGIQAAVSLGLAVGNSQNGLNVLSLVTDREREEAQKIEVDVKLASNVPALYIAVKAYGENDNSFVSIENEHDRFSRLMRNGEVLEIGNLFQDECSTELNQDFLDEMTLSDIVDFAEHIDDELKELLYRAVDTNLCIAYAGIESDWGLSVGKTMSGEIHNINTLDKAMRKGAAMAAAGADARMAGSVRPVMINSGSGNQGITVTVPVAIVAEFLKKSRDEMLTAVAISETVGLVLTNRKSRLSALCGAFTAAIGTATAWAYLLGADLGQMNDTINNMVGNLTGIICDGAKRTCALKIYSSLIGASVAVHLAMKGKSCNEESGIVGADALESIIHLSRISHEGMQQTDKTILDIMLEKGKNRH